MAVTLTTAARNAACNAIVDLLDVGAGANGTVSLRLANGSTVVATLPLSEPAFGAAASGVATMDASPTVEDTNATGNASPVTLALFMDEDGVEVFRCSVGTSGADINLTNNVIAATETVQLTSFTLTVPAS